MPIHAIRPQLSRGPEIAALCLAVWESGMGLWLIVKGLNADAIAAVETPSSASH